MAGENTTPKIENPVQEIESLKERIKELESKYESAIPPKESVEIKKEALKEHIEAAEEKLDESYKLSSNALHDCGAAVGQKASENEQIEALFEIAKEKGIANAFKVARALNNPHIMDAFHDAFIKYHDKIMGESGK